MEQRSRVMERNVELGLLVTRDGLSPPESGLAWVELISAGGECNHVGDCTFTLMCRADGSWWSRLDPPPDLVFHPTASEDLGPFESELVALRAVACRALVCLEIAARSLDVEPDCS